MARIDSLFTAVRTTNPTAAGDERSSISPAESRTLARAVNMESYGSTPERRAVAAALISAPDSFATRAAYDSFVTSARSLAPASVPRLATTAMVRAVEVDEVSSTYSIRLRGREIGTSNTGGGQPVVAVLGNGRFVVWNTRGSVGGDEASGHAVMSFDVTTGVTTQLLNGYDELYEIREVRLPSGDLMFLATGQSGGGGETSTHFIDPARGWVASAEGAFRRIGKDDDGQPAFHLMSEGTEGDLVPVTYPVSALASAEPIHVEPDDFGDEYVPHQLMLDTFAEDGGLPTTAADSPARVGAAFTALNRQLGGDASMFVFDVTNEYDNSQTFYAVTSGSQTYILNESGIVIAH